MTSSIKRNARVVVVRKNLAVSLAAVLPAFIFWNTGTVHKVSGDRIFCAWAGVGAFWFDADALEVAQ